MKKTTIICDGCGGTILPAFNGVYPAAKINLYFSHSPVGKIDSDQLRVSELCEPCYKMLHGSVKAVLEACKQVGELRDAD